MPSTARHHAEWLSLIEISGPFSAQQHAERPDHGQVHSLSQLACLEIVLSPELFEGFSNSPLGAMRSSAVTKFIMPPATR